jgi:NAD(P)-dependent dehydrogenase (short-subunit alcohol dehydrogenase family)
MARVFITGSSDGLGLMAAKLLIEQGHDVVLHGRNDQRCRDARAAAPGAKDSVSGDFSTITGAKSVAEQVNKLGRFNAVIHNAGIGYREPRRADAAPGVPSVFAVNVLAPYILTALIERPDRLVYVSSGMHRGVRPRMDDVLWTKRSWSGASAYAESKLCDVLLAFAVARRWPNVLSNALEPGWVPTKMGGRSAPGDITKAHVTQAWLATSDDPLARSSYGQQLVTA